jgi:O-antigen/teichoic acid export membrane protein
MAAISISMMLRSTLSLCVLSLAVYFGGAMVGGAAGLVLSATAVLLAFDVPVGLGLLKTTPMAAFGEATHYGQTLLAAPRAAILRLGSLAMAGLPLGLVLMLVSLNLNIPRYFIERSLGTREQGILSSLANLVAAGSVVIGALGQCLTPGLARHFAAGRMQAFRRLLWLLVMTSCGLGGVGFAVALMFGRQVLTLIYRPEFADRVDVFISLMAASGVLYLGSTMGVAITAVRCFAPQIPLFAISAASTALVCLVLVPRMGLQGAAIAIFVSAFIQSGGGALLLRKACRRRRELA